MVKAFGLMIGLLSMCEVMGLHMYIALVDLDWDCEEGLMIGLLSMCEVMGLHMYAALVDDD